MPKMESSSAAMAQGEMPTPTPTPPASGNVRRRRRRCLLTSPQPGSLYDILHDHAGLQLFVRPLSWTDLHAKLLGCRFVRLASHETPTPPSSQSSSSSLSQLPRNTPPCSIDMQRTLDLLVSPNQPEYPKTNALINLLSEFYPNTFTYPQDQVDLDLRFGNRRYPQSVRCQLLYNHIYPNDHLASFDSSTTRATNFSASQLSMSSNLSAPNEPSMLAYVSRSRLNFTRRTCFNIMKGPNGSLNHPVHRLQSLRSKSLVPKNADEDSYFIAVMLAMAQQAVYRDLASDTEFAPRDVKVHVLTIDEEENSFIVYTGVVPASLLVMFHEPVAAPTGNTGIKVEYTQVPLWPILGLKERLAKALGTDLLGKSDATIVDNHEIEVLPTPDLETSPPVFRSHLFHPKPHLRKRKRGVFSELLNASFSEKREFHQPLDTSNQKRRVQEQQPLDTPNKKRRVQEGRLLDTSSKKRRIQEGHVGVRSLFDLDEHAWKIR
ncbi:hypothetical protein F5Y01DRAFT_278830 [Xylaria sp. FL0043]|nr:hypothetical protein F5Y01DRAFT_278830 [Xylaria sp. FL0043]